MLILTRRVGETLMIGGIKKEEAEEEAALLDAAVEEGE